MNRIGTPQFNHTRVLSSLINYVQKAQPKKVSFRVAEKILQSTLMPGDLGSVIEEFHCEEPLVTLPSSVDSTIYQFPPELKEDFRKLGTNYPRPNLPGNLPERHEVVGCLYQFFGRVSFYNPISQASPVGLTILVENESWPIRKGYKGILYLFPSEEQDNRDISSIPIQVSFTGLKSRR